MTINVMLLIEPPMSASRLRVDIPHIYLSGGYWRVTLWNRDRRMLDSWNRAHNYIFPLNAARTRGRWPLPTKLPPVCVI